jgi:transcriptional/translational regulatory protein YebC/TACO1
MAKEAGEEVKKAEASRDSALEYAQEADTYPPKIQKLIDDQQNDDDGDTIAENAANKIVAIV